MELENKQEVVQSVVEATVKSGINWTDLGKKGACAAVLALGAYGAYKLLEKPVKAAIGKISEKFKVKDETGMLYTEEATPTCEPITEVK